MGRLFTVDSGTGINIFALLLFLVINAYNDEVKSQTRLFSALLCCLMPSCRQRGTLCVLRSQEVGVGKSGICHHQNDFCIKMDKNEGLFYI